MTESPAEALAPHVKLFLKEQREAEQKAHGKRVEARQKEKQSD